VAIINKLFLGIFIVLLLILGLLALSLKQSQTEGIKQVSVGGVLVQVEVADTPAEHVRGLSNRASLPEQGGMLFIFPQESEWQFWMKDTLIPLDIIWADEEGTIVTIARNVSPESYPEAYTSTKPAKYVLEVNGGFSDIHGIAEGMRIVVQ
jgi:uncharacterized protein